MRTKSLSLTRPMQIMLIIALILSLVLSFFIVPTASRDGPNIQPILLQIPPLVYHGFKCISEYEAIMINCPTEVYNHNDPDEFRIDPHGSDIPYDWSRREG